MGVAAGATLMTRRMLGLEMVESLAKTVPQTATLDGNNANVRVVR